MCHRYEGPLDVPRRCMRQTYRSNISINNPEDYWRVVVRNEYLTHVEMELGSRFSAMEQQLVQGLQQLPRTCLNTNVTMVAKTLVNSFKVDLPNISGFKLTKELDRWKRWAAAKLDKTTSLATVAETVDSIAATAYPNIATLLLMRPQSSVQTHLSNSSKLAFIAQ